MLFKGCSEHFGKLRRTDDIEESNNNAIGEAPNPSDASTEAADLLKCNGCTRKSRVEGECLNCSIAMCENCGFNCAECNAPLCLNCVNLFDCGTPDSPCCSRCKMYI